MLKNILIASILLCSTAFATTPASVGWQNGANLIKGPQNPTTTAINAPIGVFYISTATNHTYIKTDDGLSTNWIDLSGGGSGGSAAWGSITGTLSNQTDLESALTALAPLSSPAFTGNVSVSGSLGIATASPSAPLDIEATTTATSGSIFGMKNWYVQNPSTDSTASSIATSSINKVNVGYTHNLNMLEAIDGQVDTDGSGTVTLAAGLGGQVYNNQSGTITNAYGSYLGVYNVNSGIIGSGYGVFVDTPSSIGSGTMTNWYGAYVNGASYATNSFGIYEVGGKNYFSGLMGIGTSSPAWPVDIQATSTATSGTVYGVKELYTVDPASNSSSKFQGISGSTRTLNTNSHNFSIIKASYFEADHNGTGTVSYLTGVGGAAYNNTGGTVTNAYGAYLGAYNANGSIITNGFGAFVDSPYGNGGSGSMTNWYGLYVHGDSYATNSYAIFSVGGQNYFNGLISAVGGITVGGLLTLPVQGSGVTPSGAVNGSVAFTNAHILCVYNGTSWVTASTGTVACTF